MNVTVSAHLARRVAELLMLAVDLPTQESVLTEEGRSILGDLGERLPSGRRGFTAGHGEPTVDVAVLEDLDVVRLSGFLDLLGGTPDVPPVVREDATACARQLWEAMSRASTSNRPHSARGDGTEPVIDLQEPAEGVGDRRNPRR